MLAIGVDSAMIKIDRTEDKGYLHSVYEKFLREMLKESREMVQRQDRHGFGNSVVGVLNLKEPDIGKLDYVLLRLRLNPLDESDPSEWAQQTLRAIEEAKKRAKK